MRILAVSTVKMTNPLFKKTANDFNVIENKKNPIWGNKVKVIKRQLFR